MLRFERIAVRTVVMGRHPLTKRAQLMITISNALMLMGAIVLLYVGGVYTNAEYGRYAARGDTDVPAPPPVIPAESPSIIGLGSLSRPREAAEPAPFAPAQIPEAHNAELPEGQLASVVPKVAEAIEISTVSRVVIPSIDVDSKVVSVGWEVKISRGERVALWQVAEYAVGHHLGSANPGEGENIVLAGHVGGYGKVFRDLHSIDVGDKITLYSGGVPYDYTVSQKLIVDEEGVPPEQQAANARYIAATGHETVTLVTCWPATGKLKFTQRIIVRAIPVRPGDTHQSQVSGERW
jgi:sortase A